MYRLKIVRFEIPNRETHADRFFIDMSQVDDGWTNDEWKW